MMQLVTIAATLALMSIPPTTVQRAEMMMFTARYDAVVTPFVTRQNAAYAAMGDGFYAGSEQAITISEKAQTANAICARTAAAVRSMMIPASLPEADQERVRAYIRAKAVVYDSRCAQTRALIAYVDDPSKSSNEAALRRADATQTRLVAQGWSAIAPVFTRLKMRKPAAW